MIPKARGGLDVGGHGRGFHTLRLETISFGPLAIRVSARELRADGASLEKATAFEIDGDDVPGSDATPFASTSATPASHVAELSTWRVGVGSAWHFELLVPA